MSLGHKHAGWQGLLAGGFETMKTFLLILAGILPHDGAMLREEVPVVEINHYHDCECHEIFVQVIFWHEGNVLAWRFNKDMIWSYHPPRLTWVDQGKVRVVEIGVLKESWTQNYDPELKARETLPKERRKGLRSR